jgi:hypothetical protein
LLIPYFGEPVCTGGRLTRSFPKGDKWDMGIMFDQIDTEVRNKIVDYIYDNV